MGQYFLKPDIFRKNTGDEKILAFTKKILANLSTLQLLASSMFGILRKRLVFSTETPSNG